MLGKLRIIDFSYNPLLELIDVELIKEYAQKYNYNIVSFRDGSFVGALGTETIDNRMAIVYKDDKEKLQEHMSYKKIKSISFAEINKRYKATIEVINVGKEEKIARKLIDSMPIRVLGANIFADQSRISFINIKDSEVIIETNFIKEPIAAIDTKALNILKDSKLLFTGDHKVINEMILDSIFNGEVKYTEWSGL